MLHAKRVSSLANATLGVVSSASLAVNTILDGVCARRRTERQVGAKEWFPDRTKEWTEGNPCATFS